MFLTLLAPIFIFVIAEILNPKKNKILAYSKIIDCLKTNKDILTHLIFVTHLYHT